MNWAKHEDGANLKLFNEAQNMTIVACRTSVAFWQWPYRWDDDFQVPKLSGKLQLEF